MVDSFVLDSNIVVAVERSDAGLSWDVSDDPSGIMQHMIESGTRLVIDSGGHILQEWQNCVNGEWFENWFFALSATANLAEIDAVRDHALERKLRVEHGFPQAENIWLVRTAVAESELKDSCCLLTEDMDFRDPRKKKASATTREKYLSGTIVGPVEKALKKVGVQVVSLCSY